MNRRCSASKGNGDPCKRPAVKGASVCASHGARAPQVAAKAAVRAEVMAWGLGSADVDPGEILLRLVSQSAARAERYARELEQIVADTRAQYPDAEDIITKALVGETWVVAEQGDAYKAGEYIRGMAQLEAQERDRCAGFAAKGIAAGLAERQVRLAEREGALIADVLRAVLADPELGLSDEQRRAVPDVARRHLAVSS